MNLPIIQGVIDRRILVNFRVDPAVLGRLLPPPFRPKLAHDYGIAGVCLIRLKALRPRFLPEFMGLTSENAAHRVAVEWLTREGIQQGVYIPRRDTSAWVNRALGGRLFPGYHEAADFEVQESDRMISVALRSRDGETRVKVRGHISDQLPSSSIFQSVQEVSRFFEAGSVAFSATHEEGHFDGLELRTREWQVEPLEVEQVESSFFADPNRFPPGSAMFDNALLMRGIEHEWHPKESLCCSDVEAVAV